MFDLDAIQDALRTSGLDGWLLYDFRGSNMLARRVLGLEGKSVTSRRFFCMIPANGEPTRLVHRIETEVLDHLPGEKRIYLRWSELESELQRMTAGKSRIAMEYSPRNAIPYISKADAGTVELIKSFGVEVISSGDLIQRFEAVWDEDQERMHFEAEKHTTSAYDAVWAMIADRIRAGRPATECEAQAFIMDHFRRNGLTTYSPPIVGVGPHSGNPHFDTSPETDTPIREGDFVLIDLWAKMDKPRAVYSDLTRVGYAGAVVPDRYQSVLKVVAQARDAAIALVQERFAQKQPLQGWEVDDAARDVIETAGYGAHFVHRTGHNIGQEVHGNGVNMDNLETRDERLVMPGVCFSIEPGIYLPEFGARSEVNVYIDRNGKVHVTGGPLQTEVLAILK